MITLQWPDCFYKKKQIQGPIDLGEYTPLVWAAKNNNLAIVYRLLANHANPNPEVTKATLL